jgi:hypothetical protein
MMNRSGELARRPDGTPRSVLCVGIPAVGHLNPMLRQAVELRQRGWQVALASTSEMRGYVEREFPNVRFVDLGADRTGAVGGAELQARVSAQPNFVSGTMDILRSVNALWPMMFDALVDEVRRDRPDVMVVDLFTAAGMDAAEVNGVPYVVNNADLLTAVSVDLLPAAPGVPLLFTGRSIKRMGVRDRLLDPALRLVGSTIFDVTLGADLNRLRKDPWTAPAAHDAPPGRCADHDQLGVWHRVQPAAAATAADGRADARRDVARGVAR